MLHFFSRNRTHSLEHSYREFIICILFVLCCIGLFWLAPNVAYTQALPPPPCAGLVLPGCTGPMENAVQKYVIPEFARLLLNIVAGLSVVFVIIGGGRYLLSFGKEEENTKAARTITWALVGVIVALTSERLINMILTETYVTSIGSDTPFQFLATVARFIVTILNATFFIIIVVSGMRMLTAAGKDEEVTKARRMATYAVTGVVIINLAPVITKAVLNMI